MNSLVTSAVLVLGTLAVASPEATAQFNPPAIHYTLTQDAVQTFGCLPPCLCAIGIVPAQGGFDLTPRLFTPLNFDVYDLSNIVITYPNLNQGGISTAVGSGTYTIANQVLPIQSMVLDLSIDGGPVQTFQSNADPANFGSNFPLIQIDVADNAFVCLNRIFTIDAKPDLSTNFCISTPNSSGGAAQIGASGSSSLTANNLVLFAGPVPTNVPGIFFFGPDVDQTPFGDGFRCVGTNGLRRLAPVVTSNNTGIMSLAVDNQQSPMFPLFSPGSSYAFQGWFRDIAAGGSGFNLTNGTGVLMTL